MASVADRIIDFFLPVFTTWGYLIVLGGVFLESLFFTGWAAPGTTVVLLGAFYSAQGALNPVLVGLCAVAGAFAGDNLGYFIGWRGGGWIMRRYGERKKFRDGLEKTESYFSRYGGVTVILGRMLSGIDAFIPLWAGIGKMPYARYVAYDIPGICLWTGVFMTVGYLFGEHWETIDKVINYLGWGLLALAAVVVAVVFLVSRRRRSRGRPPAAPGADTR